MVYSIVIDLGFTITDIEYPYVVDKGNVILNRLIRMYKGKHKFNDPRLQGHKGNVLSIMRIYPDRTSETIYNNGWE